MKTIFILLGVSATGYVAHTDSVRWHSLIMGGITLALAVLAAWNHLSNNGWRVRF